MGTSHSMLQVSLGSHHKSQPECACLGPMPGTQRLRYWCQEVSQELAPGSSSLLARCTAVWVLPYGCLGLNVTALHTHRPMLAWTWLCTPGPLPPCRGTHTDVCWLGNSWLVFGYWRCLRNMESGQVPFGLLHIKKKIGADAQKVTYLSDSCYHQSTCHIQSHSPGPVAGPSVGKAITPEGYFTQICILVFGWFSELVLFTH